MTNILLIEENEKAAFYIANSEADELSQKVKKPALIFYKNTPENLKESMPSTLNEAIDVFTHYNPELEVLLGKYGHLQYDAISLWQNGEKDLRYNLGHMCGGLSPREQNGSEKYSLLDNRYFSALKNSPTNFLDRFHVFSCLSTFLRRYTFLELEGRFERGDYCLDPMKEIFNAQNPSELEQIMGNSESTIPYCKNLDEREKPYHFFRSGKGKAKWLGLDLWFPNEQERLDRIKRFINEYWPTEFLPIAEDINKTRNWVRSLKS